MEYSRPSCGSSSASKHDLQDYRDFSVEIDGTLYQFDRDGCASCDSPRTHSLRNTICIHGILLDISVVSLSLIWIYVDNTIVIPRGIATVKISARVPANAPGCIAFEFDSKLRAIDFKAEHDSLPLRSICIPSSVEIISEQCFSKCKSLSLFTFEPNSKLTRFEKLTLSGCGSLQFVYVPASVEVIGEKCFDDCKSLFSLIFESDSKLTIIEAGALSGCSSLKSLCLPASLQEINSSALADTNISKLSVSEGNSHFRVCDDFLLDFAGVSILHYFGSDSNVTVNRTIEVLGAYCFYGRTCLC
jgi:hypothetical protein